MKKEFLLSFQLSKMIIFEVDYYTLGNNKTPHFSTSTAEFIRSKRDFARVGQGQEDLLVDFNIAMVFYKKWNNKHLQNLTIYEYKEMIKDLKKLKECYNFIEKEPTRYNNNISFYDLVQLSKKELKKF